MHLIHFLFPSVCCAVKTRCYHIMATCRAAFHPHSLHSTEAVKRNGQWVVTDDTVASDVLLSAQSRHGGQVVDTYDREPVEALA